MVNLRLQKRLSASILKCGKRKIWLDPNEMNEIGIANTRTSVRKLVRDGFIIKKPQKVHSRFRARRRAVEKKKGRHLGLGKRKGTSNARNPVKLLWMKRQRAFRRLLKRFKENGKIDKKQYHRLYLQAKGNAFKSKANLSDNIESELAERRRTRALLVQFKAREQAARQRKAARDAQRRKKEEDLQKLVEEAEKLVYKQKPEKGVKKTPAKPEKPKKKKPEKAGNKSIEKGQEPEKGKGKGKNKGKDKGKDKDKGKSVEKEKSGKPEKGKGKATDKSSKDQPKKVTGKEDKDKDKDKKADTAEKQKPKKGSGKGQQASGEDSPKKKKKGNK